MSDAIITDANDALNYILGGKGKMTLVSKKTEKRYTYKFSTQDNAMIFARLLTGSDNERDYSYLGYILSNRPALNAGKKGNPTKSAFKALNWAISQFSNSAMPDDLEVWHNGKCGKCGRGLTVPESIVTGLGPVCRSRS